jgi:capping protein (actin filament) muscle Z-line, beta
MFQLYTKAYYSPLAVSSCYLWEFGENIQDGFAVVILIKNSVTLEKKIDSGIYDSTNLITVNFVYRKSQFGQEYIEVIYKLTTTVVLSMFITDERIGDVNVSGSLTKQVEETKEIYDDDLLDNNFHVSNIGSMVEILENNIRNVLEEVYLKKSREVIIL